MSTIKYISIREFSKYHEIDQSVLDQFVQEGLIQIHTQDDDDYIVEEAIEPLESMIRLHHDLEINPAGLETIMYMRARMTEMQTQLRKMEYRLHKYEQLISQFLEK